MSGDSSKTQTNVSTFHRCQNTCDMDYVTFYGQYLFRILKSYKVFVIVCHYHLSQIFLDNAGTLE